MGELLSIKDKKPRKKISLLIGSGFSIPFGIPGVSKLNKRLRKIDHSEIAIHTDLHCFFLNGRKDPSPWNSPYDKLFIQDFLDFYCDRILKSEEDFNYEVFFDYYSLYRRRGENKEIEVFVEEFKEKYNPPFEYNAKQWLYNFDRNFNQLISSQLFDAKLFNDVSYSNFPPYDSFIGFLSNISDSYDIDIHSLNHDLLLEFLGYKHSNLYGKFSNGYTTKGSPIYGKVIVDFHHHDPEVHKEYDIRLPYYSGEYPNPISLYKLHGSITTKIIHNTNNSADVRLFRIMNDYNVQDYYIENTIEGRIDRSYAIDNVEPEFLTGTTEKMSRYLENPHFNLLLKQFEESLSLAESLLVIGYGFNDKGINDRIEKYYSSRGNHIKVIDIRTPESEWLNKQHYQLKKIKNNLSEISVEDFIEFLRG